MWDADSDALPIDLANAAAHIELHAGPWQTLALSTFLSLATLFEKTGVVGERRGAEHIWFGFASHKATSRTRGRGCCRILRTLEGLPYISVEQELGGGQTTTVNAGQSFEGERERE